MYFRPQFPCSVHFKVDGVSCCQTDITCPSLKELEDGVRAYVCQLTNVFEMLAQLITFCYYHPDVTIECFDYPCDQRDDNWEWKYDYFE